MPTMSSYELKVTGLLKEVDGAQAAAAREAFVRMFPAPAEAPPDSWVASFFLPQDTVLAGDALVEDGSRTVMSGSTLEAGSTLTKGSKLNGKSLTEDTVLEAPVAVTEATALKRDTLLKRGTLLKNREYTTFLWTADTEDVPESDDAATPGGVAEQRKYGLLSFQALVGVVRPGALGQHWARRTARDELNWFYNYKKAEWFRRLLAALLEFNRSWGEAGMDVLEEEVRIRDLKWYCGNGGGP